MHFGKWRRQMEGSIKVFVGWTGSLESPTLPPSFYATVGISQSVRVSCFGPPVRGHIEKRQEVA